MCEYPGSLVDPQPPSVPCLGMVTAARDQAPPREKVSRGQVYWDVPFGSFYWPGSGVESKSFFPWFDLSFKLHRTASTAHMSQGMAGDVFSDIHGKGLLS